MPLISKSDLILMRAIYRIHIFNYKNMERKLTLQDAKKISLDILININEFCKANGIKYSLGFGTILGAVRHKLFILWYDDIDI